MTGGRTGSELPRPTAFVFGGGAASTAAQVGMLAAAEEAGLRPDLIVGTSAGALNGVLLADRPDSAVQRLTRVWTTCDRSTVIGDSRLRTVRNLLGGHHMFRNHRLARLFTEQVRARTFAELAVPFACVATDLDSGSAVVLRDGALVDALLATCAIPGVFPLVRMGRRHLADGGYVANVPVRQALDLGAASIVVFDGRPRIASRGAPRDVRDSIRAAFAATLNQQYDSDVAHARRHVPVLCPPGQAAEHVKGFDFSTVETMIVTARAAARDYFAGLGAFDASRSAG
ncbi:patatin-like phospholipase family protein [Umezawaea endophytica]|uniref:Patatin-like phospholipase family protein n=1 Tax=Umezawaea endophytica TaxID=1654476 RepID=A0A9X2VVR8_9PSEU|nr:patatin-like phospholipase family protein [Umezawaea endophytica]MCS7483521.1 patatin-like phospholipase family protein [Umezawaea endophytica]